MWWSVISYNYCLSLGDLAPPCSESAGEKRIRLASVTFECTTQSVGLVQAIYESLLFQDHTGGLASFRPTTANREYRLLMCPIFSSASGVGSSWSTTLFDQFRMNLYDIGPLTLAPPLPRLRLWHWVKRLNSYLIHCHSICMNCNHYCDPWTVHLAPSSRQNF